MNAADFARAKRYKKLTAKLNSGQTKAKSDSWRKHAQLAILFLAVIHTAAFITSRVMLSSQSSFVTLVSHSSRSS